MVSIRECGHPIKGFFYSSQEKWTCFGCFQPTAFAIKNPVESRVENTTRRHFQVHLVSCCHIICNKFFASGLPAFHENSLGICSISCFQSVPCPTSPVWALSRNWFSMSLGGFSMSSMTEWSYSGQSQHPLGVRRQTPLPQALRICFYRLRMLESHHIYDQKGKTLCWW